MSALVDKKRFSKQETFPALWTGKLLLVSVDLHVFPEACFTEETSAALGTREGLLTGVDDLVFVEL